MGDAIEVEDILIKYDYSLKSKEERGKYVEDTLSHIDEIPPYMVMGYSNECMDSGMKTNDIPKMIDDYATYLLESTNTGVERTEYTFFVSKRDEMRRKTNREINNIGQYMDDESLDNQRYQFIESLCEQNNSIDINLDVLKHNLSIEIKDISFYSRVLSFSSDLITSTEDEELIEMINGVILNCAKNAKDDMDTCILENYIRGYSLREIARDNGISPSTVKRRIDNMLT